MQWLKNTFKHLPVAILVNLIYWFPARKMNLIGITGTDGKTTVSLLIHHILNYIGINTGLISTIETKIKNLTIPTGLHVTSPHPFKLQKFLKMMLKNDIQWVVLETTSHGLDQHRFWGLKFKIGILTNLSHEHLDYHKTFVSYLDSKLKLFQNSEIAIINKDDPSYTKVADRLKKMKKKMITFAIKNAADLKAEKIKLTPRGTNFLLSYNLHRRENKILISSPLIGEFNVLNQLAAIGAVLTTGLADLTQVKEAIEKFLPPKGRMEEIPNNRGIKIIIDFAHTPNGLQQVLSTFRKVYPSKRLIVVFGCAGLRDIQKRPIMGKIAAQLADILVLTSEDPRTENPLTIIQQIAQGCRQAGIKRLSTKKEYFNQKGYYILENRQQAINFAIRNLAKEQDIVLLCGKGHEKSICYGKTEYPWSEHQAVKIALKQK